MITYKCKNCGGEMSINASGDLWCAFCGTKMNFSDADLRFYKQFRNEMLSYLAAVAKNKVDPLATRALWDYSEKASYVTADGDDVTINYLFRSEDDGIPMYMGKDSIIYVFPKNRQEDAGKMLANVAAITFPEADVKSLNNYLPSLKAKLLLEDGGVLLAFSKHENMYPLEAFGSVEAPHAEWILSRLENICCLLEYNDVVHGGIRLESVCINPFTHELSLYGGWWKMRHKGLIGDSDLKDIRKLCTRALGVNAGKAPKPFLEFLDSKPCADAYLDFKAWDTVIEKQLGGHHFTKFEI